MNPMLKLHLKTSQGGVKNREIFIKTFNKTFTEIFIPKKNLWNFPSPIATLPEKDRATATGDRHKQFREDRSSGSRDMLADRQTHADRETNLSQYSAPLPGRSD